jgi:hypothetical protein
MLDAIEFMLLRAEVEAATRVPEFAEVNRRAGGVKLRDRLATTAAMFATLAVFAPVGVAAMNAQHEPQPLGFNVDSSDFSPLPLPYVPDDEKSDQPQPNLVTLRAVTQLDDGRKFGAVDVCVGAASARRCSLQVSRLPETGAVSRPVAVGLLRQQPTESLGSVELVAGSSRSVLVLGSAAGRSRTVARVVVSSGLITTPPAPDRVLEGAPGDQLVQFREFGEPYALRRSDDSITRLAQVPALRQPTVVTSIPASLGWWITGYDPTSSELMVAVSRDRGRSWMVRPLGVPQGIDAPTLATNDGMTVYAFVRSSDKLRQVKSTDGGASWTVQPAGLPWPAALSEPGALAGRGFGALVRSDDSTVIWIEDSIAPVFLESRTGGRSYQQVEGPGGRICPVGEEYLSLGEHPAISSNGVDWVALATPPHTLPN